MSPKKVSVSIVNYNTKGFLEGCISSVLAQDYPDIEVVLVDNASLDGSAEFVRDRFPSVKIIENAQNLYFAEGQNVGIRASAGEYVLALNTDVVLEKDFVSEMVRAIESDDRVGSVSGKIMRPDKKTIDTAGQSVGRNRKPVDRGYGETDKGQYDTPGFIFGAGGVCPLYRRAMLDDVAIEGEYFDETYGMYYEDLDLAWRAHARGWKAYYTPKAVACHERGGTGKQVRPFLNILRGYDMAYLPDELKAMLLANRYKTMLKNDKLPDFLLNLPFIILYDIKIWAFVVLFCPGVIPGFLRGLRHLPAAWRRRKLIHGV